MHATGPAPHACPAPLIASTPCALGEADFSFHAAQPQLRPLSQQCTGHTTPLLRRFSLSFRKPEWWCLQPKNKHPLPLGVYWDLFCLINADCFHSLVSEILKSVSRLFASICFSDGATHATRAAPMATAAKQGQASTGVRRGNLPRKPAAKAGVGISLWGPGRGGRAG